MSNVIKLSVFFISACRVVQVTNKFHMVDFYFHFQFQIWVIVVSDHKTMSKFTTVQMV
jgi:hypothetical protein